MKEAIPRRVLPVILANPRWSRRASRNRHISGIASLTSRTGVVTIVEGERAAYERRNDDCAGVADSIWESSYGLFLPQPLLASRR